jgi:hypothetical protein
MLVLKLFGAAVMISNFCSYFLIRKKSEKIFQIYYELKTYRLENFNSNRKDNFFSIISFITILLATGLTALMTFSDQNLDNLFKSISATTSLRPYSIIVQFYVNGWMILIQLIYYELYAQYYSNIESFNEKLKTVSEPNPDLIIMTQKTILTFMRFHWSLKNNIDFIEYFIIVSVISRNGSLICLLISNPNLNFNSYLSIISYVIISISYFFLIQVSIFKKSIIQQELYKIIEKWQNFRRKDELSIELSVLKYTMDEFNKNKRIIEESSV